MSTHLFRSGRSILIATIIVAAFWAFLTHTGNSTVGAPSAHLSLLAPAFVQTAHAADNALSFIESEAGISAYYQIPSGITLSVVKPLFRTMEKETADYLVGSIPVPDWYAESEDVHVYIHKDGWVLAYYLKADPVSKLFDWKNYTPGNIVTKFDTILKRIADQLQVAAPPATYYHFQQPNANSLLLIAERRMKNAQIESDSFEVKLPDPLTYYERSWSLTCMDSGESELFINEQSLKKAECTAANALEGSYGVLTPTQMNVNVFHKIRLYHYWTNEEVFGGLALTYREQ